MTALVYNTQCIADSEREFETTQAEIEVIVQQQEAEQLAINAANAPADAEDNSMLIYGGIGAGVVILIIVLAMCCRKSKPADSGNSSV